MIELNPLECALNEADALRELVVTVRAENAKLRKENDTLCHRIDELCAENERLRQENQSIGVAAYELGRKSMADENAKLREER